MEYVEGDDLEKKLAEESLSSDEAFRIAAEVCEALEFAHSRGILHRDIKPANLLLSREGHAKVADFGIAKLLADEEEKEVGITITGTTVGTPFFMAPEMWVSPDRVDRRADIYSLGAVLYYMLTGEHPSGNFENPSKCAKLPRYVDFPILKALAKAPDSRYANAAMFRRDLLAKQRRLKRVWKTRSAVAISLVGIASLFAVTFQPLTQWQRNQSLEASNTEDTNQPADRESRGRIYMHGVGTEQSQILSSMTGDLEEIGFSVVHVRDVGKEAALPISTEVRYFKEPSEAEGAKAIRNILRATPSLADAQALFVAGYGDRNRALHYEIWAGRDLASSKKTIGRQIRTRRAERPTGHLRFQEASDLNTDSSSPLLKEYDDFVAVHVSDSHWYTLRNNGHLLSSRSTHERRYVAAISGGPLNPIGLIDTGGGIEIFASGELFPPSDFPPSPSGRSVADIQVGSGHAIMLLDNGTTIPWGARYQRALDAPDIANEYASAQWKSPPPLDGKHVAIAAGHLFAAALRDDGQLVVWGENGQFHCDELNQYSPIKKIRGDGENLVALSQSGIAILLTISLSHSDGSPLPVQEIGPASKITPGFFFESKSGWLPIPVDATLTHGPELSPRLQYGQIARFPDRDNKPSMLYWISPK
ncbi:UNVERIFIED_CONTAM: hypothetical protein GTU68_014484 [Idotea baltica]|nr:hypothetical protein [Idotea baltica]